VDYPSFRLVAHTAKSAGAAGTAKAMPFDEALKKLESIVDAMETGDLPLESLLAQFEEGTHLIRICQKKLEEAELKIQQLEVTAAGETAVKPFAVDAED